MTAIDLDPVLERAAAGQPLTAAERDVLMHAPDLLALGMAADQVRRARHGSAMTFVRVAHVPCTAEPDPRAWAGAGEVRLTGVPPDWIEAPSLVRRVRDLAPAHLPLTGFSLADLLDGVGGDAGALAALARALRGAGLEQVAEAPLDRLAQPGAALDAVAAGGLQVLRLTVDRLAPEEQRSLLDRAADCVAARPAIRALAPLPRRLSAGHPSTGFEDVRLVALARLLVPVDHIQVDWPLYGPKLAQVGLTFGADDVDGVSPLDDTGEGRRRAPLEEIRRNIRAASGEPRERDGRFGPRG